MELLLLFILGFLLGKRGGGRKVFTRPEPKTNPPMERR
jgi:hypothetical protein